MTLTYLTYTTFLFFEKSKRIMQTGFQNLCLCRRYGGGGAEGLAQIRTEVLSLLWQETASQVA